VEPREPARACERLPQGCRSSTPPRPLSVCPPPPLSARGLWAPAMPRSVSWAALGRGAVGGRDTQRHEVLRLERRQGGGEWALAPDCAHHPCRHLRHPQDGGRLLRRLLVPPPSRAL